MLLWGPGGRVRGPATRSNEPHKQSFLIWTEAPDDHTWNVSLDMDSYQMSVRVRRLWRPDYWRLRWINEMR